MKKTLLITSVLLAFVCFSCDDEPIDSNIVLDSPTTGGNTGGGTGGGNGGGGNGGGGTTATLTSYSYDVVSTLPIFGPITTNIDFNVEQNIVTSLNVELIILGASDTSVATITRDGNGRIIETEGINSGSVTDRTTVTYAGNNIVEINYENLDDSSENYTYTFVHNGNTVTRTNAAANESAVFTFNASSQLISKESFSGTVSTQLENLTYTNGNCSVSTITGEGAATNTYVYDSFTNPSKTVFSDQYLLTLFDSDNNDEVGSVIAIFHSTNNWIRLEADQGNVDFNVTYDAENKITSRNGNFDLGDGISVSQSETFQY